MDRACDIAIVGAGPAGAAAAIEASRLGCGRIMLIDKAPLGRLKPCGGGLSPRARKVLGRMGVWKAVEKEAYPISGLRLVSPSGREVVLAGSETASILDRSSFDTILAQTAAREGAVLEFGTRVNGLIERAGRIVGVRSEAGDILARWTLVANGATSRLVPDPRPRRLLYTCMAWFDGVPFTPHILEMVYDPDLKPHYGWLFPETSKRVNIGICMFADRLRGHSIRDIFGDFLERHFGKRLAGACQIGRWRSHPISTTAAVSHDAPPGVLKAGEANRLANIATGEGISYALESGLLAARAISAGDSGDWSLERTADYYNDLLKGSFAWRFRTAELFTRHGMGLLDTAAALGNLGPVRSAVARSLARL